MEDYGCELRFDVHESFIEVHETENPGPMDWGCFAWTGEYERVTWRPQDDPTDRIEDAIDDAMDDARR
jgi:hypothetical protein